MSDDSLLFASALLLAAFYDTTQRRVPNWLNMVLLLTGLAYAVFEHQGVERALAIGCAFLVVLPFFHFRVYRGGDAKLLIACGAWVSAFTWLVGFAIGMCLGALHAVVLLAVDSRDRQRAKQNLWLLYFSRLGTLGDERDTGRPTIPMAVHFGLGMMLVRQLDVLSLLGV